MGKGLLPTGGVRPALEGELRMTDDNPYAPTSGRRPLAAPGPMPDPRFGTPPGAQPHARVRARPAVRSPLRRANRSRRSRPTQYSAYVPPSYPPPGYDYRPPLIKTNRGLGTALLILGGTLVAALLLRRHRPVGRPRLRRGLGAWGRPAHACTTAHDAVGILFIVILPMWIVGSLWLAQAHHNAQALAPAHLRRSVVWCWLGWIVPIVSWWFPKQIVDDTWQVTATPAASDLGGALPHDCCLVGVLGRVSVLLFGFQDRQGVYFSADTLPDRHLGVRPGLELRRSRSWASWPTRSGCRSCSA